MSDYFGRGYNYDSDSDVEDERGGALDYRIFLNYIGRGLNNDSDNEESSSSEDENPRGGSLYDLDDYY